MGDILRGPRRNWPALEALSADGPHPPGAQTLRLFGQLIGSWEFHGVKYDLGGGAHEHSGEWHFAWILEGRAIQDVLISPSRKDRTRGESANSYGTSIRFYDARIERWKVVWIDPVNGSLSLLTAKPDRGNILMEGTTADGRPMRWIWSDITATSARWRSSFPWTTEPAGS